MYKMFALIVLLAAPVLVTLVDNLVPKRPVAIQARGGRDAGDVTSPPAQATPAPVASADAPSAAGMPTLDPVGLEPAPMLNTGPAAPPVAVTAAPAVPLGEAVAPPPPGAKLSNDDHP